MLRERPLAVCVPWPPSPALREQRLVANYGACLAVAFFAKAEELVRRGAALLAEWAERGRGLDGRWSVN